MRATGTLIVILLLLFASACGGENSERPTAPEEPGTTVEPGVIEEPGTTVEPGIVEEARANAQPELPAVALVIRTSAGEAVEVRAEVADERAEKGQGLSGRTELAENAGMLFVYNYWEKQRTFQMRETLIPLSIAFIDSEGSIVDIQDMQPLDQETYPSAEPAKYALEVNQGFFAERGVEVGDTVEIPEEYR